MALPAACLPPIIPFSPSALRSYSLARRACCLACPAHSPPAAARWVGSHGWLGLPSQRSVPAGLAQRTQRACLLAMVPGILATQLYPSITALPPCLPVPLPGCLFPSPPHLLASSSPHHLAPSVTPLPPQTHLPGYVADYDKLKAAGGEQLGRFMCLQMQAGPLHLHHQPMAHHQCPHPLPQFLGPHTAAAALRLLQPR